MHTVCIEQVAGKLSEACTSDQYLTIRVDI
jgi:hypothetical protein